MLIQLLQVMLEIRNYWSLSPSVVLQGNVCDDVVVAVGGDAEGGSGLYYCDVVVVDDVCYYCCHESLVHYVRLRDLWLHQCAFYK